ncbi:MAG TPA: rhodanese-like domain-containing protein [Burkholderiales bacterium]
MEHLPPKRAMEFLQRNPDALFIDCRSEMEYLFVGHPVGALHVAWNDGPDWEVNPHFVGQVKKLAGVQHAMRPIVLICRSGNRSQEAGGALERAGFTRVFNVEHGFEGELDERHHRNARAGWRFEGLPWEQC